MPAPKGEQHWAKWAYDFVQIGKVSDHPNRDFAAVMGHTSNTVGTMALRMRQRGFLLRREDGTYDITQRTQNILNTMRGMQDGGVVAFDLRVRAKTKAEALAEVWDVISQLEHWDPRTGEPFRLSNARIRNIGMNSA